MNRQEIRTQILRSLNDDPNDPVFWSKDEINDNIQEAMEIIAEEATSLKRTYYTVRRAGTFIYEIEGIGDNIQTPYRIWLPDLKRRLESWSLTDLDREHSLWMDVTGDPWVWVPIDWRQFIVWPIPATQGGTMEVNCFVWPDELMLDTDEPEFHWSDHEAIVRFGEMDGYLKQWDVRRATDLLVQFTRGWRDARAISGVKQMQSHFNVRENTRGNDGDRWG